MLSNNEFELWCHKNNISDVGKSYIELVRSSEPSRSVRSGPKNVAGFYPSRKMGVTIQFESHKNELARIIVFERGKKTKEYLDQPRPINLRYQDTNGRNIGFLHTPDFFILEDEGAGWEECKTEEELLKLESKNPNRYRRDEEGHWRCPPGEAVAAEYGFFYRVTSSKEICWVFLRNAEFLEDYFRIDSPEVSPLVRQAVVKHVLQKPGISLKELFDLTYGSAERDDIYMMIAHEFIFVDLYAVALTEPEYVKVYPDQVTAIAYAHVIKVPSSAIIHAPSYVDVKHGSLINWNSNIWKIVNVGDGLVGMLAEDKSFTEFPLAVFEELVNEGRITGVQRDPITKTHPEVERRIGEAKKEDLAEANRRVAIVRTSFQGEPLPESIPERTLDRWKRAYREAEQKYQCGYIGLIRLPRKGNPEPKLSPESQKFLEDFIKEKHETLKQLRKRAAHTLYWGACNEDEVKKRGVSAASYKTFSRAVKRRPKEEQTLKRQGHRAAYKVKEFYMELTLTTPRHGERPFHIGHIDHTEADTEFLCARTLKNLGRPWVTSMTDAYSRRNLAKVLCFDPPSYRSCMLVVRECVRRFRRIPQIVIVDGGLEFSSVYFDTLLSRNESTKKERTGKPNFGSTHERLYGTANTQFWHNLQGNTLATKDVRQLTKATDPKRHALWTLEAGDQKFTEWAYEVYDTIEHPALGQSPREAFNDGIDLYGERKHRLIPYDEHFRIMTCPATDKGTAKVQSNGVKINYRYFHASTLDHPDVQGTNIPVRFDPWDGGLAYAYALGNWVMCRSEKYVIFHGRSEREIMLATAILRQKDNLHGRNQSITTAKLAAFLQSVEAQEALLRQQLADRAAQSAWEALQAYPSLVKSKSDAPMDDATPDVTPQTGRQADAVTTSDIRADEFTVQAYGDF